jgi:two-component system KDP operon response regulator KdpE
VNRVLIIDDNTLHRRVLVDALAHVGFSVEQAADGATGLRQVFSSRPDVVLLDVMMPGMDGWEVCKRIRELCDTPIIMLTSLNREEEMIRGLDLGADDFVSKPASPDHLLARIRAVLRRAERGPPPASLDYDDGVLSIDATRHEVRLNGEPVTLTPTEFRLLSTLAQAPERVHPFAELLSTIWGPAYIDDIEFLRVYIWRLRKKLEANPEHPRWLITERGFGYRFRAGERGDDAAGRQQP